MRRLQGRRKTILFFSAIVFIGMLLCLRARYGVELTDESYYLAEAGRFFQGDRPFREEWFPAQLIGVLLLPAYSVYCMVHGDTEGIILFMRLLYALFRTAAALLTFWTLTRKEKMDWFPALMASLLFLFYARANIQTLSYYNIGLITFLIYLLWRQEKGFFYQAGSGISFAVSVLCMPYLALYFAFMEALHAMQCVKGQRKWQEEAAFLSGILLSAAVVLGFFLSAGDMPDIFQNLPEILKDPEHQGTIWESVYSFVSFMIRDFYRFLFWPQMLECLGIACYIWKGRRPERLGGLLKAFAYLLFLAQAVYVRTFFEGGIIIVFFVLALQVAVLTDRRERTLWEHYALPGLLYGMLWMCGSNVGQRVFNMGCLLACIWAAQIIWKDACGSLRRWARILKLGAALAVLGILVLICFLDVYRDGSIEKLTVRLEAGAAKGIYTTPQRAEEYADVLEALAIYAGEGKVLAVEGTNPWLYLESDAQCGAYTAWSVDFTDERNELYYERYPDKIPDVIFLLKPSYGTYEGWRYSSHGSNKEGMGTDMLEGWLEKLAEEEVYCRLEEESGIFYVKE